MEEISSAEEHVGIGDYLENMYYKVEKDNSVTGKIGRVRIVMFIEEEVNNPQYDGPR